MSDDRVWTQSDYLDAMVPTSAAWYRNFRDLGPLTPEQEEWWKAYVHFTDVPDRPKGGK